MHCPEQHIEGMKENDRQYSNNIQNSRVDVLCYHHTQQSHFAIAMWYLSLLCTNEFIAHHLVEKENFCNCFHFGCTETQPQWGHFEGKYVTVLQRKNELH